MNDDFWADAEDIAILLTGVEDLELDCDGVSDHVSLALEENGIEHTRLCGSVEDRQTGDVVLPHCWIELADGVIVDYRLRKWLGDDDDIPHGVFIPQNRFCYSGIKEQRERDTDRG